MPKPQIPLPGTPAPRSPSWPPSAADDLVRHQQEEKAEEHKRAISVALWTKIAAIAAIVGAVASIVAAIFALLAWLFPMQG